MILDIITIEESPNSPALTRPSRTVEFPLTQTMQVLIANLKDTQESTGGLGLAAPQVGESWRIFFLELNQDAVTIRRDVNETFPLTVFINPSYEVVESMGTYLDWEGCFSVSSIAGEVRRYRQIKYQYYNEIGEKISGTASGLLARAIQHETDHTMGKLMVDRFTKECRQGTHKQVQAWRREEMNESERTAYDRLVKLSTVKKK